jgi:hypothetical protein
MAKVHDPSFALAQVGDIQTNHERFYDVINAEEDKELIRRLHELKHTVDNSMRRKKYDCVKAFGNKQYCDCLTQHLPVGVLSFPQYVILVTSTREELNYDQMQNMDKELVDLSMAARNTCVKKTFQSQNQLSQNTHPEYRKVRAEAKEWSHKDWTTINNTDLVRYTTHGSSVWGHQFGLIKQKSSCEADILWIVWSTYDQAIQQLSGSEATIEIDIDGTSFRISVKMQVARQSTPLLSVAVLTNFLVGPKLIDLLERGRKVDVSIIGPENLTQHIDIASDSFSLTGFIANRLKAQEFCQESTP